MPSICSFVIKIGIFINGLDVLLRAAEPGPWDSPRCSYVIVHVQSQLYLDIYIYRFCSEQSLVVTLLRQIILYIIYRAHVYVAICCNIRHTGSPCVHIVELFCCLDFFQVCFGFARA